MSQYILGIRPTYDGLCIDPCIPPDWKDFRASRRYRGGLYEIEVTNPGAVSKGVRSITLDGKPVEGQVLSICPPGKTVHVNVIMGP